MAYQLQEINQRIREDVRGFLEECDAEYGSCDDQGFYSFRAQNYVITVLTGATCQNDTAVPSASPRKVAVLYHREAGSTNLCANN